MFGRLTLVVVLVGCGSSGSGSESRAGSGSAVIESGVHDAQVIDARVIDAPSPDAAEAAQVTEPEPPSNPADDEMACSPDDPRCTGPLENAHKVPSGSDTRPAPKRTTQRRKR